MNGTSKLNVDVIRMNVAKVLPLVYDDSLSYYEVLCKVVNKINEIIENIDDAVIAVINEELAHLMFDTLYDEETETLTLSLKKGE